jgi:hypothetical protein
MTLPGDSFGGVNGVDDMVVNVASVSSAAGSEDDHMLVVKYNSAGAIQWQKAILFDAGLDSTGADADIDSEGNVYVCGQYEVNEPTLSGVCMNLVKFNSAGVKQWSRRVEGDCGSIATSIVVGADDKLYLSGSLFSSTVPNPGPGDPIDISCVVAKYNLDGTVVWQRLLDNTELLSVSGSDFLSEQGGGSNLAVKQDYVALAGGFGTNPGDFRALIAQLPAAGDLFTVSVWDFKASSLTGTLNTGASDITVVDADKTDTDNTSNITVATVTPTVDSSAFLIGTLYSAPGSNNSLVNNGNQLVLESTGTLTLPAGGTISEGYVTSNPTIQLTPDNPTVVSQKLVIKGGGSYPNTENGIYLNTYTITWAVSTAVEFYVYDPTRANETLYWWIVPEGSGISTTMSGTVALDGIGDGNFTFTLDSDAYEFRVRVSPEDNNYDPNNTGVESVLINGDEPTFEGEHHLHLTTGNLEVTSIFLGTDNHNVRTTVDGGIQVTTGGQFNICTIDNAGSGYTSGTTIPAATTGGTGTGMTADFGYGIEGQLVSVSVNNPGTGYTNGDVITVGGGTGTFVLTRYNNLANQGNSNSFQSAWNFSADGVLTFPDGTSQTGVFTGYDYEIHVSQTDGDDTTGNGDLLKPVASITKALTLISGQRRTIVIHPGSYTESPLITTQYTVLTTFEPLGGNTAIIGTVSTSVGCTITGLTIENLTITAGTGVGVPNIINCNISGTLTKSGNAAFTDIHNCDIGTACNITGNGLVTINDGNPSFVTVNNAGASVIIKNSMSCIAPSVIAGTLNVVDAVVIAAVTNAVTSSASTVVSLANCQILTSALTAVAPVSLSGFYSFFNCVFDKPNSTLVALSATGGSTNSVDYFQYINADRLILASGGQITFPDDTVQTTAYPGITTVAKTGVVLPTTTGVVTTLAHDSVLTGLTDATYGPFTLGVVTFSVVVFGGVINSISSLSSSGDVTVDDAIGQMPDTFVGGPGGTTITWTIGSVVQETPIAIDLTKTVNKLSDGLYTLADGVEGQIMYLVAQNGVVPTDVSVLVANSRNIGVGTLLPFSVYDNSDDSYYGSIGGICTLIFTDGAWQQSGGAWEIIT